MVFKIPPHLPEAHAAALIMKSGNPYYSKLITRDEDKERSFKNLLATANCSKALDSLACLRSAPVSSLLEAASDPISVDGEILPESGATAMASGHFIKVPTIVGTNRNEGTNIFALVAKPPVNSSSDFQAVLDGLNPYSTITAKDHRSILDLYMKAAKSPGDSGLCTVLADYAGDYYGATTLMVGDAVFIAGRRSTNQHFAAHHVPTYSYFFDTTTAVLSAQEYGAAHFQEIPFVFANTQGVGWDVNPFPAGHQEPYHRLAETMSRMWISFATTHCPNFHKLPHVEVEWPIYEEKNPVNLAFTLKGVHKQADTWRKEANELMLGLIP